MYTQTPHERTNLDTHIWGCSTDEAEGGTDVDAHDDVPRVVGRRVQHTVKREAGVVHDVVDLSKLSVRAKAVRTPRSEGSAVTVRAPWRTAHVGEERRHVLDRRRDDFFREVVCRDISADSERVAARRLDLVDDGLRLLLLKTAGATQSREITTPQAT